MTNISPDPHSSLTEPIDPMDWVAERGMGSLADTMGIRMVAFDHDHAIATMPVAGNTQPVGIVHGGAYVVLGESLGSMHANLVAGPGKLALGIDINATHTRSASEGIVTGTCRPLHVGRSLAVHEIVVTDEQGRRLSTIRITNTIVDKR